ncbi:MAG: IS3 family transposase [Oscillospiraceae bacterium]
MRISTEQKQKLVTRYYSGESITDICKEMGVSRSTFYTWLKPYQSTVTEAGHTVTAAEFVKMKKKLEKLEQKLEVLQTVNCTVSAPLQKKLYALEALHGQYSIHILCEALKVDRGTFYNHLLRNKKDQSSYQFRRTELSEQIRQVYDESNQIYGAKKIKAVLASRGIAVSDKMVAELMNEMNISSIRTGAKKDYLRFNADKKKDSLKMNFTVDAPNQVWVSDVTYFKLNGKFHYICAIIDLYSRKVIAHKISKKHSTQLITATFKLAYDARKPTVGLIFHSDRGTQYTSNSFQKLLVTCQVEQSFSPSGRPHHNAVMESFFASMKKEELYRTNYHSNEEFKRRIQEYINFHNNERPHATLAYKTPNAHEVTFYERPPQN